MEIYVGTYEKYNNGSIEGAWVSLEQFDDYQGFIDHCKELHRDEEDPEFMFQDWEGDFPLGWINESYLDKRVFDLLQHSDEDIKKVEDYIAHVLGQGYDKHLDVDEILQEVEDHLVCAVDDWKDIAEERFVEERQVPEHLQAYINWEMVRNDFRIENTFGSEYVWDPS